MTKLAQAAVSVFFVAVTLGAEPVTVRYAEVEARAPLVLRAPGGATLADGEWVQKVTATDVTSRVVFRFKDGSLHDETVVFSQDGHFRVLRDRLVQRGAAFPYDIEFSIDTTSGEVTVLSRERDGSQRRFSEHMQLPADLSNGIVPSVLKNVRPQSPPASVSLLVATPRPRLVQLRLGPPRRERLTSSADAAVANHYVLKVDIGGFAGRVAPLLGKQPPDSHVWIADGDPPLFVRSEQPFFVGGPLWRIDVLR